MALLALVLVVAALAAIVTLADLGSPLRPAVAALFLCTCPGIAFAHALRLRDRLAELTIGVALSLAINTIVVGGLLFAGVSSTVPVLTVLVCITVVAVVFALRVAEDTSAGGRRRA